MTLLVGLIISLGHVVTLGAHTFGMQIICRKKEGLVEVTKMYEVG